MTTTSNLAEALPEVPSKRTDEDGWRWYGNKVSVTTVIENAVANPKLMQWFKKNSEKKVEKVRKETADFGTEGHKYFEKILKGEQVIEFPESHRPHVETFIAWAREHKVKARHTELAMVSERLGFAGTCDFLGEIDGELAIADWKLTARYRITNGWQMGAYRIMAREIFGFEQLGMVGLQVDRRTAEPKMFKYQHFDFCEHAFLCSLEVFKALHFNKLAKLEWPWLKERAV